MTEDATELVIKYPTDEENNGIYAMAWRGASVVTDLYTVTATNLLLKYLTEYAVSPLPKEFVEIEDPYASRVTTLSNNSLFKKTFVLSHFWFDAISLFFQVNYNFSENSEISFAIIFQDVPIGKLSEVSPKLRAVLKKILLDEDIDMTKLHSIINKFKLEHLSNLENSPHNIIAMMIIGHMLYGNTKNDVSKMKNFRNWNY